VIGLRRGTLIVAVLTDEGLLVAADTRYSLLAPGAGVERQRKLRPVARPPSTVLCVAGVDRIVRVPGVVRAGWTPGPADVLLDFAEVAVARLPEAADDLTEDWLSRTALECARRFNDDPRIQRRPVSPSPDQPFTELILATGGQGARSARLAVAGLYPGGPGAGLSRASADILELTRVGEPHFFGDVPFLEREMPDDFARCRALLSTPRLSRDAAVSAFATLVDAAEAMPGSTIGAPTDAVLIESRLTGR